MAVWAHLTAFWLILIVWEHIPFSLNSILTLFDPIRDNNNLAFFRSLQL